MILDFFAVRYVYKVYGHWYLGAQIISADYTISGGNFLSGQLLELVGLTGFRSNGIGLLVDYDTRDNQYSPASGQLFEAFNVAFRESFGGVAYLYGDDAPDGNDAWFPSGGLGAFYQLNDEKMVVRADFAIGKYGNRGFYLQFGQPF
jgi:hypothetical protein